MVNFKFTTKFIGKFNGLFFFLFRIRISLIYIWLIIKYLYIIHYCKVIMKMLKLSDLQAPRGRHWAAMKRWQIQWKPPTPSSCPAYFQNNTSSQTGGFLHLLVPQPKSYWPLDHTAVKPSADISCPVNRISSIVLCFPDKYGLTSKGRQAFLGSVGMKERDLNKIKQTPTTIAKGPQGKNAGSRRELSEKKGRL